MQATVISVQPNVTKQGRSGPYSVHIFTYQPDSNPAYGAKPPTTRDIFTDNRANPNVPLQVAGLQAGQRVELTFTPQASNPQYKDLTAVVVLVDAPPPVQQQAPQHAAYTPPEHTPTVAAAPVSVMGGILTATPDERQLSIQKQCALKAGVEIVKALIGKEKYYAQKIKKELLAEEVLFFADEFEAHLLGIKEKFDPDQGLGEELPPPPFNPDDDIPY